MHSMGYTFMDIEIDYVVMPIHIIDYIDMYIQIHNIHTITIGEKKGHKCEVGGEKIYRRAWGRKKYCS